MSAGGVRVPPGRAGILILRRRLAVAEGGADLLTRKLTLLTAEADRLAARVAATEREWHTAASAARRRLSRAAGVGGERSLRLAALPPAAQVSLTWASLMGLRYVTETRCELPERPPTAAPPAAAALAADAAVREAVRAGARHAAAAHAVGVVAAEVRLTRQRLRALERRRIPALREALAQAHAQVEESEGADAARRRWAGAATGPASSRLGPSGPGEPGSAPRG
ncbi:V-type ATP synthase subunit D [Actinoplanes sp. NPDC049316]|uniref:V-type ATP synthase subunit D n=1 Tax=Actinoplanes sp. NPDC049316 TaxID=3154727 RepID=UPI00341CE3B3